MKDDSEVRHIYLYSEHDGIRYRIEVEVRVADMARYLAGQALRNRTKRSRVAFGKAIAHTCHLATNATRHHPDLEEVKWKTMRICRNDRT